MHHQQVITDPDGGMMAKYYTLEAALVDFSCRGESAGAVVLERCWSRPAAHAVRARGAAAAARWRPCHEPLPDNYQPQAGISGRTPR